MSEKKLRLAVIIGSTREGRSGPTVASWFVREAAAFGRFDVDVVDLAESGPPTGASTPVTARAPADAAIGARLGAADAFIVVTPEYNHSFSAPLKNLIDGHRTPWQAKPVGFVSYGGISGGLRAVEQLRLVFAELHAATIRDTVSFHMVWEQISPDGSLRAEEAAVPAKTLLEKLTWWAIALKNARTVSPYAA